MSGATLPVAVLNGVWDNLAAIAVGEEEEEAFSQLRVGWAVEEKTVPLWSQSDQDLVRREKDILRHFCLYAAEERSKLLIGTQSDHRLFRGL